MLTDLHQRYDMNHHTQSGSVQAATITPEFADRYAVLGGADEVQSRLAALAGLGLDKFVLMGVGRAPGLDEESKVAYEALVREVMPALRS